MPTISEDDRNENTTADGASVPWDCDGLKRILNSYRKTPVKPNLPAALSYIAAYTAARAKNCKFLDDFDQGYHVSPEKGGQFQLQGVAPSWDVRGPKMLVGSDGFLESNDLNRNGKYDASKDKHDLFQFVRIANEGLSGPGIPGNPAHL